MFEPCLTGSDMERSSYVFSVLIKRFRQKNSLPKKWRKTLIFEFKKKGPASSFGTITTRISDEDKGDRWFKY